MKFIQSNLQVTHGPGGRDTYSSAVIIRLFEMEPVGTSVTITHGTKPEPDLGRVPLNPWLSGEAETSQT